MLTLKVRKEEKMMGCRVIQVPGKIPEGSKGCY